MTDNHGSRPVNPWLPADDADEAPAPSWPSAQGTVSGAAPAPGPAPSWAGQAHPPQPQQPAASQPQQSAAPRFQQPYPSPQPQPPYPPQPHPQQWGAQPAWGPPPARKKRRTSLVLGSIIGALLFLGLLGGGLFLALRGEQPAGEKLPPARSELSSTTAKAKDGAFEHGVPLLSIDAIGKINEQAVQELGAPQTARARMGDSGGSIVTLKTKGLQGEGLDAQVQPYCAKLAEKAKGQSSRVTDYVAAGTTAYGCRIDSTSERNGKKYTDYVYLLAKDADVYALVVSGNAEQDGDLRAQATSSLATWKWL